MKKYENYRKIGLPWLEYIPSHWKSLRNKNIFTEQKEVVGENFTNYTLLSLTLNGIVPRNMDAGGKFPESFDKYKIVKKGNIAFCLFDIDETPRTVGVSGYDGMLTNAYTIMSIRKINRRYIYFYYLALDNKKMLKPLYTGLRKTIGIDTFQSMKIPVPPRTEQEQIVRFLDWKVSEINKLIGIKLKRILNIRDYEKQVINEKVLNGLHSSDLKYSGNKWIGCIPDNWKIISLGKFCSFQNGISESGDFFTSGTPFVGYGDVYRHIELPIKVNGKAQANKKQQELFSVQKDDIFFTRTSENLEEIGMAAVCCHTIDKAVFSGFLIRCRQKEKYVIANYMKYYLQIPAVRNHFSSNVNIVIRASLSQNLLKTLPIVIPPENEQREIASYLDLKHTEVEKVIEITTKEIEELNELKNTLISDVVTGKIDVRNIEIPAYKHVEDVAGDGEENEEELADAEETEA